MLTGPSAADPDRQELTSRLTAVRSETVNGEIARNAARSTVGQPPVDAPHRTRHQEILKTRSITAGERSPLPSPSNASPETNTWACGSPVTTQA